MKTREKAMQWWNSHKWLVHAELSHHYYGKHYDLLTSDEIETIYKKEFS